MKALEFILSSFWHWLGFMGMLYLTFYSIGNFIIHLINRILRHANIRKHGYPPEHCDADGDFRELDVDDD